ncbi:MAG: DUF3995 domain-containing protein [Rhizobiaceae bacterium]|nr:DUF3995 domain-containing protein [Rhizobiaceae bacterium]
MTALSLVLAVPLTVIAALHAYWGVGGVWPGTDEASCARAIAGFKGMTTMPSIGASFAVAAALVFALLVALALGGWFAAPFGRIQLAGMALVIGAIFLARGVIGYLPFWRRLTPEQPFADRDRLYYSPFCLLIGAGFLALSLQGFAA